MVLIDLESVGQREIVIRFYNVPRDTKRVMLPFWEVFEGLLFLSRSSLLRRDVDHLSSRCIQRGRALIRQEFQPLDDVFAFDWYGHTSCSILDGIAPRCRVGWLSQPFFCPCP